MSAESCATAVAAAGNWAGPAGASVSADPGHRAVQPEAARHMVSPSGW